MEIKLHHIDWQECLKLSNDNPSLANDLLVMLRDELPDLKQDIMQAQTNNDVQSLADLLHKLHGSCTYTGIPKLRQIVSQLDDFMQSQPQSIEQLSLTELFTEIDNVYQELNDYFTEQQNAD